MRISREITPIFLIKYVLSSAVLINSGKAAPAKQPSLSRPRDRAAQTVENIRERLFFFKQIVPLKIIGIRFQQEVVKAL